MVYRPITVVQIIYIEPGSVCRYNLDGHARSCSLWQWRQQNTCCQSPSSTDLLNCVMEDALNRLRIDNTFSFPQTGNLNVQLLHFRVIKAFCYQFTKLRLGVGYTATDQQLLAIKSTFESTSKYWQSSLTIWHSIHGLPHHAALRLTNASYSHSLRYTCCSRIVKGWAFQLVVTAHAARSSHQ